MRYVSSRPPSSDTRRRDIETPQISQAPTHTLAVATNLAVNLAC